MNQDKFKFYINADIVKGKDEKEMKIRGIASTGDKDSQNEFLDPSTMDLTNFSYINWNHGSKDDPAKMIGEPTLARINEKNELYIEGILYDNMPMARATYQLMQALQKSPNGNRLGMSVEGRVIERDPLNPAKITKSKITGVAICPVPVNGATWTELIQKGYTDDQEPIYDLRDYTKLIEKNIEKAISVEGTTGAKENEGVDRKIEIEDVDGFDTEKKKKDKKEIDEKIDPKPIVLSKSQIYENIFNYFYIDEINKAKQIYKLIENISIMEKAPITSESIQKALDILDIAQQEIEKSQAIEEVEKVEVEDIEKAAKVKKAEDEKVENKEESEEEDDDKENPFQKGFKKEVYKSAMAEMKAMIKKGMKKEDVEKAMDCNYSKSLVKAVAEECSLMDTKANGGEISVSSISKSEIDKTVKSQLDEMIEIMKSSNDSFNEKFSAIGTIAKSQNDKIDEIMKSFEIISQENKALHERLQAIEKTPSGPKSMISKSFVDRFETTSASTNGEVYNISNKHDRNILIEKSFDLALKGDTEFADIVTSLESTGKLTDRNLRKLATTGIKVINE